MSGSVTPVRAVLSSLVGVIGVLIIVLCLRTLVVIPLRFAESPPPAPGPEGDQSATALVVFPLMLSAGLLVGLLLIWSGARGARSAARPALWRDRQGTALWGCGVGAALAVFVFAFCEEEWTGLSPDMRAPASAMFVSYSVLGFLIVAVLALQPEKRGDRPTVTR